MSCTCGIHHAPVKAHSKGPQNAVGLFNYPPGGLPSKGINAEERGATPQDHCGTAFQVAHRIVPFMQLQVSLQLPAHIQ
jgi:hypothetical protein